MSVKKGTRVIKINKEAVMPQKVLHELLGYSELTGGWVWLKKPHPSSSIKVGQPAGHMSKEGYIRIGINGHRYYAHRLAWVYVYGDFPEGGQPFIDHINGNSSDNRITNLKVSSHSDNMRNQKMNSRNKSGVTGVKRRGCWNGNKTKKNWYWIAFWCDENGRKCEKGFNIEKLGEEVAEQLAINYRTEQLQLLETNHDIKYSERHGN